MSEGGTEARIVLTTAGSREEARELGGALVEERLAACATLIPGMESIYRWKGAVERATETMVLLKTDARLMEPLEARLKELHSYETPEFLVVKVEAGSGEYLEWLRGSLGGE